jgi:hypothetical protein
MKVETSGWCFSSTRSNGRFGIQSRTRVVPDGCSPTDPHSQHGSIGIPRQVTSQWLHAKLTRSSQVSALPPAIGASAMRGTLTKARASGGDPPLQLRLT